MKRRAASGTKSISLEKQYVTSDSLFDSYDLRATILNVFEGSERVGTMRITDSADGRLEMFAMHPELEALAPTDCRCVEFSRFMVVRRCRGIRATLPVFREAILRCLPTHDAVVLSCVEELHSLLQPAFRIPSALRATVGT